MPRKIEVPEAMIRQIVNRCHVGDSCLSVCRYLLSRMKRGAFRGLPKRTRKAWLRCAIRIHEDNRKLCRRVMMGY